MGVDVGTKPDIAFRPDGTPLVAYMLERRGAAGFVRVATGADGGDFSIETLQDGYLYGPLDIEVSADWQPASPITTTTGKTPPSPCCETVRGR